MENINYLGNIVAYFKGEWMNYERGVRRSLLVPHLTSLSSIRRSPLPPLPHPEKKKSKRNGVRKTFAFVHNVFLKIMVPLPPPLHPILSTLKHSPPSHTLRHPTHWALNIPADVMEQMIDIIFTLHRECFYIVCTSDAYIHSPFLPSCNPLSPLHTHIHTLCIYTLSTLGHDPQHFSRFSVSLLLSYSLLLLAGWLAGRHFPEFSWIFWYL